MTDTTSNGWLRFLLIATLLPLCWLGMQAVHELGHVLGAMVTGAEVRRVVLHPLTISRTDLGKNPSPLIVVWSGPILGALIPTVLWMAARLIRASGDHLLRFFAGFCLVANGAYIGVAPWYAIGDGRDLLRLDPTAWPPATFGVVAITSGLLLWNGQGARFGLGPHPEPIPPMHVWATTVLLTLALMMGFVVG